MATEARAAVQYGDIRGTISIDGWDGIAAVSLGAGVPKGYWPIGLEIYGEPRKQKGRLVPTIYLLAVDTEVVGGNGPDAVHKYAKKNKSIPVFRFPTKLKLVDLLPLIKRLSIVLQDKTVRDTPLMVMEPREF
ncbi:MAG: hypothetical protein ACKVP0_05590 [Pirellulaceae bacterium]